MTALFVASFTEQWLNAKDHLPALTGLICSLLSLLLVGPEHFLIPAMVLITLVLTVFRGREEGEEATEKTGEEKESMEKKGKSEVFRDALEKGKVGKA